MLAVVGVPVRYSGEFSAAEDVCTRGVLLPLTEGVDSFLQSYSFFQSMANCTIYFFEAYLVSGQSLELYWETESFSGC